MIRRTGVFLICFAIASMLLFFADLNIRILKWVDLWGTGVGWVLRIVILGLGFGLFAKSEEWD